MKRIGMLIAAVVAALALLGGTASAVEAGNPKGSVIGMSYQDGGDSECQDGTLYQYNTWVWVSYLLEYGYYRVHHELYSCDNGHWVYVGDWWD